MEDEAQRLPLFFLTLLSDELPEAEAESEGMVETEQMCDAIKARCGRGAGAGGGKTAARREGQEARGCGCTLPERRHNATRRRRLGLR